MEVVIGFVRYVFAMNIEHTVTAEKVPDTIQNELAERIGKDVPWVRAVNWSLHLAKLMDQEVTGC
jgi:hypothetical protein